MSVIEEVAAERRRQIEHHGYTRDHDDCDHDEGQLALAAVAYATPVQLYRRYGGGGSVQFCDPWPWEYSDDARRLPHDQNPAYPGDPKSFAPEKRRRLLVKSAALLVAEIERLDRAAAAAPLVCED